MSYPEQEKEYIDGIACQYLCHIQKADAPGMVYPAHFHYYIELLYALSGTYRVYLNGIYHEFNAGDLVLINSKEIHQIDALSPQGGTYLVIRFLPELIYDSMSQHHLQLKYVLPFTSEQVTYEKIFRNLTLSASPIPHLLQEIMTEIREEPYGYELAIKNDIERIFLWILRYWHFNEKELIWENHSEQQLLVQLSPALNYMTIHFDQSITATEMADLCHLSSSYFSRTFNRLMNMNFSEYLNYIRIKEAEKLLISTSLTITEISMNVGFNSTSYFIKLFKQYKYISPKQYRKQLLQ